MAQVTQIKNGNYIGANKYTITESDNGKKEITFNPDQVLEEATPVGAEILNEIQKNGLYYLEGTKRVSGQIDIYDCTFPGLNEFNFEQLVILFKPNADSTNSTIQLNINSKIYTVEIAKFTANCVTSLMLKRNNTAIPLIIKTSEYKSGKDAEKIFTQEGANNFFKEYDNKALINRGYASDLNTALTNGVYYFNPSTSNNPMSTYGYIQVFVSNGGTHNNSDNWTWQYYYSTVGDSLWRYKVNDTSWSSWYKNWTEKNFNPDTKVNKSGDTMSGKLTINASMDLNCVSPSNDVRAYNIYGGGDRKFSIGYDFGASRIFVGKSYDDYSMSFSSNKTEITAPNLNTVGTKDIVEAINNHRAVRINFRTKVQYTSFRKTVIALCEISEGDLDSDYSSRWNETFTCGTFTIKRDNGLRETGIAQIDIAIEDSYANIGKGKGNILIKGTGIANYSDVKLCTFRYNGKLYGGLHIFIADACSDYVEFYGETNFKMFGLDYMSTDARYPLDGGDIEEVKNSLNFENIEQNVEKFYYNNAMVLTEKTNRVWETIYNSPIGSGNFKTSKSIWDYKRLLIVASNDYHNNLKNIELNISMLRATLENHRGKAYMLIDGRDYWGISADALLADGRSFNEFPNDGAENSIIQSIKVSKW